MTIEKARKLLGKVADKLSDRNITEIITSFNQIIEVGFQKFEADNEPNIFDKCRTKET